MPDDAAFRSAPSILEEGRTCWRIATADRLSIIVDAADFFHAAKEAMLAAEHSIFLIGWDFDARIELEPEGPTLEGPNEIGKFLNWISRRRRGLDVRILKWDLGVLNSLGRGETPFFMLNWMFGGRVKLKLDGAHPPLAAHHMKLLVIDETLAFCGGIDMTVGRWDTREHEENRAGRHTPRGAPLGPWHDATSCLTGPAAKALSELARMRWERATGETIEVLAGEKDIWPQRLPVDFTQVDVGIARTAPEYEDRRQICEIEAATLAIVATVRRTLYIESQYFASRKIAEAIAARLAEPDGPQILVVNPDTADGWLEAKAMDSARIRMMHLLDKADRHGRFRIVYPANEAGSPIYVHAKIMIADDRILKLGSANLNNRSLGYDTECDIVMEREEEDDEMASEILLKRDGLLAEHLGCSLEAVRAVLSETGGSLFAVLDRLDPQGRRMVPMPMRALTPDEEMLAESDIADPERPVSWKQRIASLFRRA
ncbi:phospholipase D-like domain-containing protein [Aurantimonas sp. Leaf443]|uniref:phospholipase D-like domain-containing protein n=1 Tax=Aurantimonas sp. Leaf443 TaxID=1736378 RepID=UPI0006F84EF1|nr:phospholipase D-like domain-containing protein [Aurantimonas sp. Leaf443]KQT83168.1 phospholipase [Aurantimonas sp. Leaf443]